MTQCTHITTPVDPLRWLEACDDYRTSLTDPNKQAAFDAHRFELWPFLMARDGRLHPTWSPTTWTSRISARAPARRWCTNGVDCGDDRAQLDGHLRGAIPQSRHRIGSLS